MALATNDVCQNQNRTNTDARAEIIDQVHIRKTVIIFNCHQLDKWFWNIVIKLLTSLYRVRHEVTVPKVYKH